MRAALALAAALALGACPSDSKKESFSILADNVPGGVLLSAATVGDELIFVGGQLGGGTGVIARYSDDGLCYEENAASRALWWIHSARAEEWYAVGEAGTIVHSVAGVRTEESVTTNAVLYGVWDAGDRVIAVGGDVRDTDQGEIWTRDGEGTWTLLAGELPGVLFKVWGNWIVGDGVAYYLNGDTLEERFPPAGTKFLTVNGRSDEDVWAVGGTSTPVVMHWENDDWQTVEVSPFCASQGMNGVWTGPDESVWIAGFFGAMGELAGSEWNCPPAAPTYEHFHAVWKHGDEFFWAGGNLFSVGDNHGTIGRYSKETETVTAAPCP